MNETNSNLVKVESAMEIILVTSYFNSASLATYLLIKNLREMQEMLFDTLTNVYKGHMDVHLLTPVDLVEQLSAISGRLPNTLTLPVENIRENVKDIYKLLYMKARVTSSYFLFEIHVPLTSDEDFLLYKAIPLPVKTASNISILQLQSHYIAMNFHKNTYISPSARDMELCTMLKQDRFVCNKNIPVFNLLSGKTPCEAKLLSHTSSTPCDVRKTSCDHAWIELHVPNTWLAVCCGTCTLRTVCGNDVASYTITTSSIVTLMQGCLLQSSDFTIYARNQYNTKMKMEYNFNIPLVNSTVNRIVNLTHHKVTWEVPPDTAAEETQEIDNRLSFQKEREFLPTTAISSNDMIHLYSIIYTLLGFAIVIIIIWAVRKYRPFNCTRNNNEQRKKPRYEDIELRRLDQTIQKPSSSTAPAPSQRCTERRQQNRNKTEDNFAFNFDD